MWEIILKTSAKGFTAILLLIIIIVRPGSKENIPKKGIRKINHEKSVRWNSEAALVTEEHLVTWENPNTTNLNIKSRNLTHSILYNPKYHNIGIMRDFLYLYNFAFSKTLKWT